MILNSLNVLLAQGGTAGSPMQDNPTAKLLSTGLMMVMMVIIFYFLMIRPQSKKAKEQAALLKTVKAGDKVTTSSGIVGVVVAVKDKDRTVSMRSAETKLEVLKSSIVEIDRSGETTASE